MRPHPSDRRLNFFICPVSETPSRRITPLVVFPIGIIRPPTRTRGFQPVRRVGRVWETDDSLNLAAKRRLVN